MDIFSCLPFSGVKKEVGAGCITHKSDGWVVGKRAGNSGGEKEEKVGRRGTLGGGCGASRDSQRKKAKGGPPFQFSANGSGPQTFYKNLFQPMAGTPMHAVKSQINAPQAFLA